MTTTKNNNSVDAAIENLTYAAHAIAKGDKVEYIARLDETEAILKLQGAEIAEIVIIRNAA